MTSCCDGRKIRILAIIDTLSRFSQALDPRFAYKAGDVVQTLERAGKAVGYPRVIRAGNGPELSLATWTFEPIDAALLGISAGPASRPTTPSPSPSTARSGPNA